MAGKPFPSAPSYEASPVFAHARLRNVLDTTRASSTKADVSADPHDNQVGSSRHFISRSVRMELDGDHTMTALRSCASNIMTKPTISTAMNVVDHGIWLLVIRCYWLLPALPALRRVGFPPSISCILSTISTFPRRFIPACEWSGPTAVRPPYQISPRRDAIFLGMSRIKRTIRNGFCQRSGCGYLRGRQTFPPGEYGWNCPRW